MIKQETIDSSSEDDSSSEEGADDVNTNDESDSSAPLKPKDGTNAAKKHVNRTESNRSEDNTSSKVIPGDSSSDSDNDTCADLTDREKLLEEKDRTENSTPSQLSMDNIVTQDHTLPPLPSNDGQSLNADTALAKQQPINVNGIPPQVVVEECKHPKLVFSDVIEVNEANPVGKPMPATRFSTSNTFQPHRRPVIDVDEVKARAEKVVAAVVAEAKEVAEAAAKAEAKSRLKEGNSGSEESLERQDVQNCEWASSGS